MVSALQRVASLAGCCVCVQQPARPWLNFRSCGSLGPFPDQLHARPIGLLRQLRCAAATTAGGYALQRCSPAGLELGVDGDLGSVCAGRTCLGVMCVEHNRAAARQMSKDALGVCDIRICLVRGGSDSDKMHETDCTVFHLRHLQRERRVPEVIRGSAHIPHIIKPCASIRKQ